MKKYEIPEMEVKAFAVEDIMTVSHPSAEDIPDVPNGIGWG